MVNAFSVAVVLVMTAAYLMYEHLKFQKPRRRARELFFKALSTAAAAGLCLYGCVARQAAAPGWLLFVGLCVCTAADVVLDLRFVYGMGLFALGHGCYMAAYVLAAPPDGRSLIVFAVLFAACLSQYGRLKNKYGAAHNVKPRYCLYYATVLCVMLALAVTQKGVLLCGAALFVLSDFLLSIRYMRAITGKPYDYICLGTYYLAQLLIGASVLV